MSPWEKVRERYQRDGTFRALVDMLQGAILRLQLTPSEVREAAMLACCLVEERHPKPVTYPMHNDELEAFARWKGEAK